jgi:hypothetical protein
MIATKLTVSVERKLARNYSTQCVRVGAEIELEEGDSFDDAAREWAERCKALVREQLHPVKKESENPEPEATAAEQSKSEDTGKKEENQNAPEPVKSETAKEESSPNGFKIGQTLRNKKHPDQEATIVSFIAPDQWTIKSHVNGKRYETDADTLNRMYEIAKGMKPSVTDDDEDDFDGE